MRKNKRPRSLYNSLVGDFILIAVLPMLLILAGTTTMIYSSLKRMSVVKNRDIIESMNEDLMILMSSIESDIEDIRILRDFTFIDDWALQSYMDRKVESSPVIDRIQIINGSSRVVSQAPYNDSMLGIDLSRHPFILESGNRSGFLWSQSFLSSTTGMPTATVMRRYRGYSIIFYVNLTILGSTLVVDEAEDSQIYGYAFILDRDGTYLAHPDPEMVRRRENERGDPAVMGLIADQDDEIRAIHVDRSILVLKKVSHTAWILGFRQPMKAIFPLIETYSILTVSAAAIAIGLAVLLAYRIRNMLSPLKRLISATAAVSSGDYDLDMGYVPVLEVSELSHHFEAMVDVIHEREANLDRQVKERTLELEESLEELRRTQDQLVLNERMAALGGMVSGVAHEINTPIGIGYTAITFLLDEITSLKRVRDSRSLPDDEWDTFLGKVEESSRIIDKGLRQAAHLVKSFKQVAVDQAGAEQRQFNIREYIDDVIAVLHPVWRNRDVEINVDCSEVLIIESYPGAFGQILNNLIMNSLVHGFSNDCEGRIDISAHSDNGRIILEYRDNGAGMDENTRSKIYDPFFTTRRNQGGSGLGMNIVYNLVNQLFKGTINCESRLGEGVLFRISFDPGRGGNPQ